MGRQRWRDKERERDGEGAFQPRNAKAEEGRNFKRTNKKMNTSKFIMGWLQEKQVPSA